MRALFGGLLIVVRRYRYMFAWLVLCMVLPAVLGALSGCSLPPERLHYWSGHEHLAGPYGSW